MVIPVIHCFDANFVPAAAVAFLSMLEHADKAHEYRFYVMHSDIDERRQTELKRIVGRFPNASLEFMDMKERLDAEFDGLATHAHYSKEVLYKLLTPSLFPQYDRAVITDVDVMYRRDFSAEFVRFDIDGADSDKYLAGISWRKFGKRLKCFPSMKNDYRKFSEEDYRKIQDGVGGGFLFFNLRKMREDGIERMMMDCLDAKAGILRQSEQDVINLCCSRAIKYLPPRMMVCTFQWELPSADELKLIQEELDNAVQVHFAGADKPWNASTCLFVEEWFAYLMRTPFLKDTLHGGFDYTGKWNYTFCGIPLVRRKTTTRRTSARLFGFLPLKEKRIA